MSAPHGDAAVNDIEGAAEAEETLLALVKAAFPHERVPEAAYRRAAETVRCAAEESAWMRVKLAHGLYSLEALAGERFAELTPAEALPLLLRIELYDGEPLVEVVSDLPRAATTKSVRGAAVPAGQSRARAGRTGRGTKGRA